MKTIIKVQLTDKIREMIAREIWRPFVGGLYRVYMIEVAQELNKTNMFEWDDLDALRTAIARFYHDVFPEKEISKEAKELIRRYDKDPEIVQSA